MGRNIGLDFGTTYSALAEVVENINGNYEPVALSVSGEVSSRTGLYYDSLAVKDDDGLKYGMTAHAIIGKENTTTYRGFKLLLDYDYENEADRKRLEEEGYTRDCLPKTVVKGFLKELLNKYADDISNLIVGVPYIWKNSELSHNPKDVFLEIINELNVRGNIDTINEPEAACEYFSDQYRAFNNGQFYKGYVLIVDYGGGTLDISLCNVTDEMGKPNVEVIDKAGAGANTSGRLGEAGLAFMTEIVRLSLERAHVNNEDMSLIKEHGRLDSMALNFEENLIAFGSKQEFEEFKSVFQELNLSVLKDKCEDDEEIKHLTINGQIPRVIDNEVLWRQIALPVTYGIIARAYKDIIYDPLEKGLQRIKNKIKELEIDYSGGSENFKIQIIGGFGNFCLVEEQIRHFFNISAIRDDDNRFYGGLPSGDARTMAVAYGAALEADGRAKHTTTWDNSIGIESVEAKVNEKGEIEKIPEIYWAGEKNQELVYDRVYLFKDNSGEAGAFMPGDIKELAYINVYQEDTHYMPLDDELHSKMTFPLGVGKKAGCLMGISIDRRDIITFHWWEITNPQIFDEVSSMIEDELNSEKKKPKLVEDGKMGKVRLRELGKLDGNKGVKNLRK